MTIKEPTHPHAKNWKTLLHNYSNEIGETIMPTISRIIIIHQKAEFLPISRNIVENSATTTKAYADSTKTLTYPRVNKRQYEV